MIEQICIALHNHKICHNHKPQSFLLKKIENCSIFQLKWSTICKRNTCSFSLSGRLNYQFPVLEQKYRMNRRHILPKEDERRWPQHRDTVPRSYYPHRPIMAFPPYHSHHIAYPVWGLQGNHQPPMQYWSTTSYPTLQPAENWQWKPHPGVKIYALFKRSSDIYYYTPIVFSHGKYTPNL